MKHIRHSPSFQPGALKLTFYAHFEDIYIFVCRHYLYLVQRFADNRIACHYKIQLSIQKVQASLHLFRAIEHHECQFPCLHSQIRTSLCRVIRPTVEGFMLNIISLRYLNIESKLFRNVSIFELRSFIIVKCEKSLHQKTPSSARHLTIGG